MMTVADYSFEGVNWCGVMWGKKIGGTKGEVEGFQSDESRDYLA